MPLRNKAVGGKRGMQRTGSDSVGIGQIPAGDGSEAHQIKVSILHDQRVERPLDQANPSRQGIFPLKNLQSPADTAIAILVKYGCHVGVKKWLAPAPPGNRQGESDEFGIVKCAEDLPSCFRRDDEK